MLRKAPARSHTGFVLRETATPRSARGASRSRPSRWESSRRSLYSCSASPELVEIRAHGQPWQPNPAGPEAPLSQRSGDGDGSAGGLDLLLRRGGERLGADVDLDREVPLAEHLDRVTVADGTLGHEPVDGDLATV